MQSPSGSYARAWLNVPEDLIDFTPEMRAEAVERLKHYRVEGMFTPPVVGDPNKWLGGISMGNATGGTNWAGGGFDPETHTVYVQAANSFVSAVSLRKPPEGFSDIKYVMGRDWQSFRVVEGPGYGSAADYPQPTKRPPAAAAPTAAPAATPPAGGGTTFIQGRPLVKPPYGTLTAINLDKGEITWQVPHGDTPDAIRNHPLLKRMNIPKTGQNGPVGLIVINGDVRHPARIEMAAILESEQARGCRARHGRDRARDVGRRRARADGPRERAHERGDGGGDAGGWRRPR